MLYADPPVEAVYHAQSGFFQAVVFVDLMLSNVNMEPNTLRSRLPACVQGSI